MDDALSIPAFLRRHNPTSEEPMKPEQEQPPSPVPNEDLERDAARLHREIGILEGKKHSLNTEITSKRKELRIVTSKLVTAEIKRRGE